MGVVRGEVWYVVVWYGLTWLWWCSDSRLCSLYSDIADKMTFCVMVI